MGLRLLELFGEGTGFGLWRGLGRVARLRLQSFLKDLELWELLGGFTWLGFGGFPGQISATGLQGLLGVLA